MADAFTPQVSERICQHMNDDHADAVALYARIYGQAADAKAARMLSIDSEGMDLVAELPGAEVPLRIRFDHPLKDSEDAHQTLIAMVRAARTQPRE